MKRRVPNLLNIEDNAKKDDHFLRHAALYAYALLAEQTGPNRNALEVERLYKNVGPTLEGSLKFKDESLSYLSRNISESSPSGLIEIQNLALSFAREQEKILAGMPFKAKEEQAPIIQAFNEAMASFPEDQKKAVEAYMALQLEEQRLKAETELRKVRRKAESNEADLRARYNSEIASAERASKSHIDRLDAAVRHFSGADRGGMSN